MAAHAGVFFFDGRPTEAERRWIDASLQPMAPDGVSIFAKDGIVMGHAACHVWTGEAGASQPVRSESGLVMTWDGRLDNRDDLCLRLHGRLAGDVSDAEIAVQLFERWGIDGLRFLIGDWSLAIWNSRDRTLHLARDYMGVRPLYYCVSDDGVMWSSSLGELATRSGRVDDLDEAFVAQFMMLRFSTELTPYAGIRGVPTATCVTLSGDRAETRQRYWRLGPGIIRYRDTRQYEEHLRALWHEAVGARLRTEGAVWAELSGGLDSSSIVCMADALINAGRVPATRLQLVSHVTLQSVEGDERRFIAEVEAKTGRRSLLLGLEEHDADYGEGDWETPLAVKSVDVATIAHMRNHCSRLILSGRAGDIVMGCFPDHSVAVLDDLAEGHFAAALGNTRLWSRACRKPVVEVASDLVRAVRKSSMGVAPANQRHTAIELLHPNLRPMTVSEDATRVDASGLRPAIRDVAMQLLRYSNGALSSVPSPPPDIVYSYPFVHRPLVDFVLAIPAHELSAPGTTRSLMRRAFEGLVPKQVLARTSKGYYPPAVMRMLRAQMRSMPPVESLQIVRRGWLAPKPLAAAIRNLTESSAQMGGEVRLAWLLEQWLISRDRQGPAAMPKRKGGDNQCDTQRLSSSCSDRRQCWCSVGTKANSTGAHRSFRSRSWKWRSDSTSA